MNSAQMNHAWRENVASQLEATASDNFTTQVIVDGGSGTLRDLLLDAAKAILAPPPTTSEAELRAEHFKTALINALVVNHAYKAEHDIDPERAIADLIAIEIDQALDPVVSERAQALMTAKPAARWCFALPPVGYTHAPIDPTSEMVDAALAGKVLPQSWEAQQRIRARIVEDYRAMVLVAPIPRREVAQPVFVGLPERKQPSHSMDGQPVMSLADEGYNRALDDVLRTVELPLTPALAEILGWPNFMCVSIATSLRSQGTPIPYKAEAEQAAVIHWLLNLYFKHGSAWREFARSEMRSIEAQGRAS